MYFCYCDETGTDGRGDTVLLLGIIADMTRYRRTAAEFRGMFEDCSATARDGLRELKSVDLYRGNGRWRGVAADERKAIIGRFVEWIGARHHRIALAALSVSSATRHEPPAGMPRANWTRVALHLVLQIQREHQNKRSGKGRTLLIFDEHPQLDDLSDLLVSPPPESDAYYRRSPRSEPLDQIVDTSMSVKSHHAGLVQVADLFAFLFRRYVELCEGDDPHWVGEFQQIESWVAQLSERLLPSASRWPSRPLDDWSRWFVAVSPESLRQLGSRRT